jgi:hypothetical protein
MRALRASILLAVVAAGVGARATPARRERGALRLEVERTPAASACPDEARLRASIAAKLGTPPSDEHRVRVVFDRRGGAFLAAIELESPGGGRRTRSLSSPASDCAELAEATALTIALATDLPPARPSTAPPASSTAPAASTARAVGPASASSATTGTVGVPPRVPPRASPAPSARKPKPPAAAGQRGARGPYVGLGISTAAFAGPAWPVGLDLEVGVLEERLGFAVELHGRYATAQAPTTGSVDVTWGWISFVPCVRGSGLFACGVLGAGFERARGAVELPRTAAAAYVVPGVRGGGELAIAPGISLFAQVELDAPVVRARVAIDGREVFHAAPVLIVGGAGVRVALP